MFRKVLKLNIHTVQLLSSANLLKCNQNIFRFFASFKPYEFTQQTTAGEGKEKLIDRFSKHVAMGNLSKESKPLEIDDIFTFEDSKTLKQNLKNLKLDELVTSIYVAKARKKDLSSSKICDFINLVDDECVQRIDELNSLELQALLTAFMFLLPNKLTQFEFYRLSILKLAQNFSGKSQDFVRVCFYLGMWKKNDLASRTMKQLLESNLPAELNNLSTLDFAIVCNSAFKTSVGFDEEKFKTRLINEIQGLKDEDVPLLVTFIKSCRLNRVKTEIIVENLKEKILSGSLNNIDLTGVIHLFTYFAENLISDPDVVDFFLQRGGIYLNETARIKDLATFLWCCAHLGLEVDNTLNLTAISDLIKVKIRSKEYDKSQDVLTDTSLALWMLGEKDIELAKAALANFSFKKNSDRVKLDSRKILLAACLDIEGNQKVTNEELFDPSRLAPKYLYNKRRGLQGIFYAMQKDPEVKSAALVAPITELNIAGIFLELNSNEKVFIEVLDKTNRTSNGTPFGLLKLKIRLLKAKNFQIVMVSPRQSPQRLTVAECLTNPPLSE